MTRGLPIHRRPPWLAVGRWCFTLSLLAAVLLAPPPAPSLAAGERVTVFWRPYCGHCTDAKEFLAGLQAGRPGLAVRLLDVSQPADRELFDRFTRLRDLPRVAPIIVVGNQVIIGFGGAGDTGREILAALATQESFPGIEELLAAGATPRGPTLPAGGTSEVAEALGGLRRLHIPGLGEVDLAQVTLPALAAILGLVDGFNPCAMWVLVAFLTALAQAGSTRRMVQLAGVFILAQGIMYLLILNFWYLAFDFIRADAIVTPIIGLVAVGAGLFFLWEARQREATCKVTGLERRSRIMGRIDHLARASFTPAVFLGILGVALSVNVIEFACSIGIPQTFTKILDLNHLTAAYRQGLLMTYVFTYMLDDLAVFGLAILAMDRIGVTGRYSRLSNLVGGVVMLGLGLVLLLAPDWLRF